MCELCCKVKKLKDQNNETELQLLEVLALLDQMASADKLKSKVSNAFPLHSLHLLDTRCAALVVSSLSDAVGCRCCPQMHY